MENDEVKGANENEVKTDLQTETEHKPVILMFLLHNGNSIMGIFNPDDETPVEDEADVLQHVVNGVMFTLEQPVLIINVNAIIPSQGRLAGQPQSLGPCIIPGFAALSAPSMTVTDFCGVTLIEEELPIAIEYMKYLDVVNSDRQKQKSVRTRLN